MGITGKIHDVSQDVEIIQGAIAGEQAGIAAYRIAGASGLLVPDTLKIAQLFKSQHEAHRDALAKLISDIGTTPVASKSDDDYVADLKLGALKSQADVLSAYSAEDDRPFRPNVTGYSAGSALAVVSTMGGHDQSRFWSLLE